MVQFSLICLAALAATGLSSPVAPRADTTPKKAPFDSNTFSSTQLTTVKNALVNTHGYGDRQAVLLPNPPDASNITFTFVNNTVEGGTGGTIALATVNNFPALIGTEVALAIGFVNPCGLNVPHSHPRANEFLTVVKGELVGGLVLELNDGSFGDVVGGNKPVLGPIAQVNTTLSNYTGMLFPQGETHFQFNPTCEPAIFAAAFDSSDPGRTQIARNFFSNMPDSVVLSALGDGETIDASKLKLLRKNIPDSFAVIIEECATKCGLSTGDN